MSKEESPAPKKTFIERMTGTTAQVAALIVAVSAVLTQVPSVAQTGREAFCAIFSCADPAPAAAQPEPQAPQPPAPQPSASQPAAGTPPAAPVAASARQEALQQAGIGLGAADPTWLLNEYTSYPFVADALLALLQGRQFRQPLSLDVVVWEYEHVANAPRSLDAVDTAKLKAAVLTAHNEAYGATESDFGALLR